MLTSCMSSSAGSVGIYLIPHCVSSELPLEQRLLIFLAGEPFLPFFFFRSALFFLLFGFYGFFLNARMHDHGVVEHLTHAQHSTAQRSNHAQSSKASADCSATNASKQTELP